MVGEVMASNKQNCHDNEWNKDGPAHGLSVLGQTIKPEGQEAEHGGGDAGDETQKSEEPELRGGHGQIVGGEEVGNEQSGEAVEGDEAVDDQAVGQADTNEPDANQEAS